MAWRYRRSIRIARGVRLNVSKSGTSLSLGGRGVTTNIGPRGTRTTYSLPGTGLSYQTSRRASGGGSVLGGLVILVLIVGGALLGGNRSATTPDGSSTPLSAQGASAGAQDASRRPTLAQATDAAVVDSQAAGQLSKPQRQLLVTPSTPVQSLDDGHDSATGTLALSINRLRVANGSAVTFDQSPTGVSAAIVLAHAPWRHVTGMGIHWNLRHPDPGKLLLQVELVGRAYANVTLDPAFESLAMDAMNTRVDYIRRTAIQSFGSETTSLIFARDGTLTRND